MALLKNHMMVFLTITMMIVEALVLFFLFGGAPATPAAEAEEDPAVAQAELVERELAQVSVDNMYDPSLITRVEFMAYAAVPKDDAAAFDAVFEERQHRIKQAVDTVVRRAHKQDLEEATLATLKRQIKESLALVLGRDTSYIQDVIVTEFKTYDL